MRFDVVSFGSAVVDAFVETEQRGRKFEYLVGSKILVEDLKFDVGGGATNTSVAFSRLGLKAGCVCKVGDDSNGEMILDSLKKEGVEFLGSIVKGKTGYSVILDSKDKNRTILVYKGVGSIIKSSDLKGFKADWLFLGSTLGESFRTGKKLAIRMKKAGSKIVFNPSEYLVGAKDIRKLLAISDVVILNRQEFDAVRRKYGKNFCEGTIVITDKNKKIVCVSEGKVYYLKPHKVKVVERTGAGDAFASGFVAGMIVGWPIERCLKLGLKESESVIKYFGAKNKLIKRKLK
jgi:ribokinase